MNYRNDEKPTFIDIKNIQWNSLQLRVVWNSTLTFLMNDWETKTLPCLAALPSSSTAETSPWLALSPPGWIGSRDNIHRKTHGKHPCFWWGKTWCRPGRFCLKSSKSGRIMMIGSTFQLGATPSAATAPPCWMSYWSGPTWPSTSGRLLQILMRWWTPDTY